jgi:hypothetical protein
MIDSLLACSPQAAYRTSALQRRPLSSSVGLEVLGVDHEAVCRPTPQLAAQYGVARLTVRRAIRELVDEERLVILRGRGTYVKQPGS